MRDIHLAGLAVSVSLDYVAPGAQTTRHRHAHEAVILVMGGRGHTVIDGRRRELTTGDIFHIRPGAWHQHAAARDEGLSYVTASNGPLLEAVGLTTAFEEADAGTPTCGEAAPQGFENPDSDQSALSKVATASQPAARASSRMT